MSADSDWALIAPYYDRTLIRNPFVYELGRELGLQAPRSAHVEVRSAAAISSSSIRRHRRNPS
ncbi:MAG TPA: CotH kinase family protein [Polyangiales bacterium]|nr:CotH kinase family protein [Polyangiales bacterium]